MLLEVTDTGENATIISIDPGTTNIGIAIIIFNPYDFKIISIEAFTIKADKLPSAEWLGDLHGERVKRLHSLKKMLDKIFKENKPNSIACESPYINMRQPAAYGALVEAVCTIRNSVIEYDSYMGLNFIEPSNVKKSVNAGWISDKNAVRDALLKIDELTSVITPSVLLLDEHSIDAVCVGYAWIKKLKGVL